MIRDRIPDTPLTTPEANAYFDTRIKGRKWDGDYSMLAVVRALLDSRMEADETFSVNIYSSCANPNSLESLMSAMRKLCERGAADNLVICNLIFSDTRDEQIAINTVSEHFRDVLPEYEEITKVRTLFDTTTLKCACFVDKNNNKSVVVCANLNIMRVHFLCMAIPGFIPWYFPFLTPGEKEMLFAMDKSTSEEFLCALGKITYGVGTKSASNSVKPVKPTENANRTKKHLPNIHIKRLCAALKHNIITDGGVPVMKWWQDIILCILVFILGALVGGGVVHTNAEEDRGHLYPRTAVVWAIDRESDTVLCEDAMGFRWEFNGVEDWQPGDCVSLIMDSRGTDSILDDEIVSARYSAWDLGR